MPFEFEDRSKWVFEAKDVFCEKERRTPYSNYLNGVQWCPDGRSLLTASADQKFRVFHVPEGMLEGEGRVDEEWPCVEIQEGEVIFDYCWYPYADETNIQTYCFLSTARGHPVHLWDASSGEMRATYRCYNAQDEIVACASVGFSADGSRIYCGARRSIYVFDIARPGREYTFVSTFSKAEGGIKGLISAMAFSRADPAIYAIGSYSGSVGILSTETDSVLLHLQGHVGGVTKVMFSGDGYFLYSGARCDGSLFCWDIRATCEPVYQLQRDTENTTQRIHFDLDPISGKHLVTGGEKGAIAAFDLATGEEAGRILVSTDTLNGAAFHPWSSHIATSSGRRHFWKVNADSLNQENVDPALRVLLFRRLEDERSRAESGDDV